MPSACFWIQRDGGQKVYFANASIENVTPERFSDARVSVSHRGIDTGGNMATGGVVSRWSACSFSLSINTHEVGDLFEMANDGGIGPYFIAITRDLALSGWTDSTPLWLILGEAVQTSANFWSISARLESQ